MGPDFHAAVGEREGVVKYAGIGEIAHGKTVEPLQWARDRTAVFLILDLDLAGKHTFILTKRHVQVSIQSAFGRTGLCRLVGRMRIAEG